tara:strand:+ start:2092 stop:2763 length:672 start_codon:yes stop_codon:yes gene_type:complete
MKNIVFIILLFWASTTFAQEITVELDNFTTVEVSKGLKVNLTQAEKNEAVITGNSRNDVKLDIKNGMLKITVDLDHLWNEDNTIVNIYFKQLLKLEAKQNSNIDICGKLSQPIFNIRVQEGADVKAKVELENLYASIVTGGNLFIIGTAAQQDIDVKAAGDFKGENLIGTDVKVSIAGGGTASIYSKAYVNAKVRAGGTIYIYGNPKKIDERTTFGGTIKKIN